MFDENTDCEYQTIYGVEERGGISAFTINTAETAALVPVPVEKSLLLFSGEIDSLEVETFTPESGIWVSERREFSCTDFIDTGDRYFYRALVTARRWLAREDHLVI